MCGRLTDRGPRLRCILAPHERLRSCPASWAFLQRVSVSARPSLYGNPSVLSVSTPTIGHRRPGWRRQPLSKSTPRASCHCW
jgi:hypothetical protein